jgi:hypothetical protein
LLYLWHLSDKEQVLSGMVHVLSKMVAANSDHVYMETQTIQCKRGISKEETEEQKEVKQFGSDISNAIAEIAKMGKSESFYQSLESYYY